MEKHHHNERQEAIGKRQEGQGHGHCHGHCHNHHQEHEHHHEHHHELKEQLVKIITTVVLLIAAVLIEKHTALSTWQLLLVYLVPYLLIGWDTLKEAAEGLAHGEAFNEHFLMSVATIGALCIGFLPGAETQFPEAVFVMLFFQVGELFEGYAEGKSRDSIAHLMDIRPDTANVERDGNLLTVNPDEVGVGETIVIRPGEKVPLDGVIIEGTTALNTVALTGESVPREVTVGDEVISGCVNTSGVVKVRTTKSFGESTVSKIIRLVEDAGEHKSKSETFITRFARIYTPVVVFAAVALALLPPLFSGHFAAAFPVWLYRALLFLVVSCPCALVISVPLTFFGGIGGASRNGILVKGANFMDILAKVDTVVFDKTGTLTHGQFAVEAVHPEQFDERQLLHLAAHVEHFSTHPVGMETEGFKHNAAGENINLLQNTTYYIVINNWLARYAFAVEQRQYSITTHCVDEAVLSAVGETEPQSQVIFSNCKTGDNKTLKRDTFSNVVDNARATAGYIFVGYSYQPTSTRIDYIPEQTITVWNADVDLYARYIRTDNVITTRNFCPTSLWGHDGNKLVLTTAIIDDDLDLQPYDAILFHNKNGTGLEEHYITSIATNGARKVLTLEAGSYVSSAYNNLQNVAYITLETEFEIICAAWDHSNFDDAYIVDKGDEFTLPDADTYCNVEDGYYLDHWQADEEEELKFYDFTTITPRRSMWLDAVVVAINGSGLLTKYNEFTVGENASGLYAEFTIKDANAATATLLSGASASNVIIVLKNNTEYSDSVAKIINSSNQTVNSATNGTGVIRVYFNGITRAELETAVMIKMA